MRPGSAQPAGKCARPVGRAIGPEQARSPRLAAVVAVTEGPCPRDQRVAARIWPPKADDDSATLLNPELRWLVAWWLVLGMLISHGCTPIRAAAPSPLVTVKGMAVKKKTSPGPGWNYDGRIGRLHGGSPLQSGFLFLG